MVAAVQAFLAFGPTAHSASNKAKRRLGATLDTGMLKGLYSRYVGWF